MQFVKSQIPSIRFQQGTWQNMSMGFLKQPEIVLLPIGKSQADDLSVFEVYQHLCFQGMTLFLPGIVPPLFFWGRSIGDSVASTRITSYSMSFFVVIIMLSQQASRYSTGKKDYGSDRIAVPEEGGGENESAKRDELQGISAAVPDRGSL